MRPPRFSCATKVTSRQRGLLPVRRQHPQHPIYDERMSTPFENAMRSQSLLRTKQDSWVALMGWVEERPTNQDWTPFKEVCIMARRHTSTHRPDTLTQTFFIQQLSLAVRRRTIHSGKVTGGRVAWANLPKSGRHHAIRQSLSALSN